MQKIALRLLYYPALTAAFIAGGLTFSLAVSSPALAGANYQCTANIQLPHFSDGAGGIIVKGTWIACAVWQADGANGLGPINTSFGPSTGFLSG
jgi:hypothetical protein